MSAADSLAEWKAALKADPLDPEVRKIMREGGPQGWDPKDRKAAVGLYTKALGRALKLPSAANRRRAEAVETRLEAMQEALREALGEAVRAAAARQGRSPA
jgi:hypothetical protein